MQLQNPIPTATSKALTPKALTMAQGSLWKKKRF